MALNSGFFNSLDGDRKYDAEDFGKLFEGIITDGVFNNVGKKFEVTAGGSNLVNVDTGRGWKSGVWFENDTPAAVELPLPEVGMNRVDSVVVNIDMTTRLTTFEVVKGPPKAGSWPIPSVTNTSTVKQVRLANIRRWPGSAVVTRDHITNTVGNSETPWITAPLTKVDFSNALDGVQKDLNAWMGQVGDVLSDNAELEIAANLVAIESKLSVINNPQNKNNFFRGKDLGTQITAAQLEEIRTGRFNDMYIGDYWRLSDGTTTRNWRIMHFDYYYGRGNTTDEHHAVIMPDDALLYGTMDSRGTISAGYMGSDWRTTHRDRATTLAHTAFKNIELYVPEEFVTRGFVSVTGIRDKLLVPTEWQVWGSQVHGNPSVYGGISSGRRNHTRSYLPFACFRLYPKAIHVENTTWWLRDLALEDNYAAVGATNIPDHRPPGQSLGFRPYFCITGVTV